jgi:hypothetical protein
MHEHENGWNGHRWWPQNPVLRVILIPLFVIGGIALAIFLAFVCGIVVQALWNWLMPEIFGLKTISFLQAFGILILAKLLFGGWGGRHFRHHDRGPNRFFRRWMKEDFDPRDFRYYRDYWRAEGKDAFKQYVERMKGGDNPPKAV